jgi:hypothetical protein
MKKATSLALAGLMGASVGAYATDSRDLGFGNVSNFIVSDSSYTTLPQVVLSYKDAAFLELAGPNNEAPKNLATYLTGTQSGSGANFALGPGALGVRIGRSAEDFYGVYAFSQIDNSREQTQFSDAGWGYLNNRIETSEETIYNFAENSAPKDRVDVIYALPVGQRVNLALGVNYAAFQDNYSDGNLGVQTETGLNRNIYGLTLGGDVKELGPFALLQIGAQLTEESIDAYANNSGKTSFFDSSATGLNVRVGGDVDRGDGRFGRMELTFQTSGLRVVSDPAQPYTWTHSDTAESDFGHSTAYSAGYAFGVRSDKALGLAGLRLLGDFGSDNNLQQVNNEGLLVKYDAYEVELSAGGEYKILDWLTARAGISGSVFSGGYASSLGEHGDVETLSSEGGNTYVESGEENAILNGYTEGAAVDPSGSAQASVGLSMVFGTFSVDAVVNQEILYSGTYLLSGNDNLLFEKLSASYAWGN